MLKDSQDIIKRRKLSLTSDNGLQITSGTFMSPDIIPSTAYPLNMALDRESPETALALTTTSTSNALPTTNTNSSSVLTLPSLTPSAMAASLLNNNVTTTPTVSIPDHYSLRWNNHQNHIMRSFDALLQTKTLVDVTLVCAETSIRAHKMVLSACSPFFQRVFADTPCKHPVIVLKDFRGWVVQAIIDFMYRGEISVPQQRLQTLMQAGESLQIRGLVESSIPEHTPTPAASPDDFGMIDTSLLSSELERCSSFDEESPSMVTSASKIILPSRLFSASKRREKERKREKERTLDHEMDHSDHEFMSEALTHNEKCTSPMPRRKQARPRRRSSDLPQDIRSQSNSPDPKDCSIESEKNDEPTELAFNACNVSIEAIKTVIKAEQMEPMEDDEVDRIEEQDIKEIQEETEIRRNEVDSGHGNDSHENSEEVQQEKARGKQNLPDFDSEINRQDDLINTGDLEDDEEEQEEEEEREEEEDLEDLILNSNELNRRRKSTMSLNSEGPEDLCTTKKDNDTSGNHSASDNDDSPLNNNDNNKLNNNHTIHNNRVVLSLKDIRQLNKPPSASTPNSSNNAMHPFTGSGIRDLRLDRASMENQCKMEALEAQMQAAAAAAAAAAASGKNPFQEMEHQMDLSLAAAAAAAAVSHQHSRERDHALHREQRELQQQHNAYANSILNQMGMPSMAPFGPSSTGPPLGPGGPAPHERLEESMNRLSKEFGPSSPMSLPSHYNPQEGPPHPPSPLPFPGMSTALTLTPPHMFGLDSPLGLFPPGIDPGKLYNPLMEMSDPRGMPSDPPPFLKKKMPRPKGQHSAPRGGPPRSWTNAELTEALQHVWNKKMTTSQASRIFGIPYNSLLMYVRGKYGKSLKLEQLRKDCISGPPLELLQMGASGGKNSGETREQREARKEAQRNAAANAAAELDLTAGLSGGHSSGPHNTSSESDLLGGPNALFNPFNPQGFYPDFPGGFPGLPLSMLNLLPPADRSQHSGVMHHGLGMDEDCKSDRSKQSSSLDDEFAAAAQSLALQRPPEERRHSDLMPNNATNNNSNPASTSSSQANGGGGTGGQQD
uniref:BTB domain-containing protein n=1 Tax=Glossina brevipalpis TaxID=37001 RepID=A0A1A9WS60_9MUSC